jgi:type VI secretion system secreted protein VgrG
MLQNGVQYSSGTQDAFAIWVPVMQPWAGAGYGAQFIPREGMEVVVGFLEDQGERPVILGCMYNAVNPPPWPAQSDQQKVGIKSQTRAADGGWSEVSIDDTQGSEDLALRAQKDMTVDVLNDVTTTVGNDVTTTIGHDESTSIAVDRSLQVGGNDTQTVTGNAERTVTGTDTLAVTGDSTTTITGDVTYSVTGTTNETLTGDVTRTLVGDVLATTSGKTDQSFTLDYTERHQGHRTVIVGTGNAQRSSTLHVEGMGRAYASTSFEVEALTGFTLVCGNSQILVSPSGITLSSPNITLSGKEVDVLAGTFKVNVSGALTMMASTATLETSGAQIALDSSSATVEASAIKLGSGSGSTSQTSAQPVKITKVQMKDSKGVPRADTRVLLVQGGKQRMTVLDAEGMLELIGDSSYQISFPDDPQAK